jgi:hypothetical protein
LLFPQIAQARLENSIGTYPSCLKTSPGSPNINHSTNLKRTLQGDMTPQG